MRFRSLCCDAFALVVFFGQFVTAEVDYSQYVDPFIGGAGPFSDLAYGGGDIFLGGSIPFGSVKVSIDTYELNATYGGQINGGWTPAGLVTGVSMLHVSGTGADAKYGLIPQMPLTDISAPVNLLDNTTYWQERVGNDSASVGYYKTNLKNGVQIELSATHHVGMMEYSFPEGEKHIVVDVSHYLPSQTGGYADQTFNGGEIQLNGSTYTGYGVYGGGWNEGAPFPVYFCGEFDTAPAGRTFRGRNTDPMARLHYLSSEPYQQAIISNDTYQSSGWINDRVGAVFSWPSDSTCTIRSKVGISFVSTEKACRFKDEEITTWNLNDTVAAAVDKWNKDVFSKIQVPTSGPSVNETNLILLYSSLYFMHLMPVDRSGENPFWDSGEPYWDDFYTLWDIHRCTVSLYHLIQPEPYESMIRALIDTWRWEGYMPDGRSGFWNGEVQGGSNSDNVLADAYVKGLRGAINWTAGYQAMLKNAEVLPINTFSHDDELDSVKDGRGVLDEWLELGFLTRDHGRSLSRATEYAVNDFSLSIVATGEAPTDVQKYLNRSANWQRLWNPTVESRSFKGFLAPKNRDGTFNLTGYDPLQCGSEDCGFGAFTFQTVPFEQSFIVPHDMATVIDFMGGADEFARRLDYIFLPNTSAQDLGVQAAAINTIMNIGNEPDFPIPYMYHYINRSARSLTQSRALANQYFKDALYGIPGNSDAGATNSWLVWSMIGLFPVTGQTTYLLGSPWFEDMNVTINGNKTLRIRSSGGEQAKLGQEGFYVKAVKINGAQWDRNWFEHKDIMVEGGTIEFEVGAVEDSWETGVVPPSPGHVELDLGW